ncbi:MAG: hypothetical protein HY000_02035, partial [Planctomycetes bacterium]|nr:hypothetical protein [Planctomycetota bacterium]
MNGTLYFFANDGVNGSELWKSDGTASGTVLVKDIRPGAFSSGPNSLVNVGLAMFFVASDGVHGPELWSSDGTAAGTSMAADLAAGSASAGISSLVPLGDSLLFQASDSAHGREIWKLSLPDRVPFLLSDINPGNSGSHVIAMARSEDLVFFSPLFSPVGDNELWKTDGTEMGTSLVKDIYAGPFGGSTTAGITAGGFYYFGAAAGSDIINDELWKTDGTEAGTTLVAEIRAGNEGSSPENLASFNGKLLFTADDGVNGRELWSIDVEPTGGVPKTVQIIDDGGTGFTQSGTWATGIGRDGDSLVAASGSASEASWAYTVIPGVFRVAVTWPASIAGAATDSLFSVLDSGISRGQAAVSQQLPPDSFVADGSSWQDLGLFNVSSASLAVRLAAAGANGNVIADAVRIERVGSLADIQVQLADSFTHVPDGGSLDFATVDQHNPLVKTFRIGNQGVQPVQLGPISLPPAYSLISPPALTTLVAGQSTTFQIELDT